MTLHRGVDLKEKNMKNISHGGYVCKCKKNNVCFLLLIAIGYIGLPITVRYMIYKPRHIMGIIHYRSAILYMTITAKNEGQIGLYGYSVFSISCDIILTLSGL